MTAAEYEAARKPLLRQKKHEEDLAGQAMLDANRALGTQYHADIQGKTDAQKAVLAAAKRRALALVSVQYRAALAEISMQYHDALDELGPPPAGQFDPNATHI